MSDEPTPSRAEITQLLQSVRQGKAGAADKLVPLVYSELRRLARHYLGNERADHTLQPTALVDDALIKLLGVDSVNWQNRAHFFALAANSMRRILVDHARHHQAEKRGGEFEKVSLDEAYLPQFSAQHLDKILAVDEALKRLAKFDPRAAQIVEMRFFAGMNEEETAEVLGLSVRTVKRDWQMARAWLRGEMMK